MKLPSAHSASVPERKVTQYLLNPAHPAGGSKVEFVGYDGHTIALLTLERDQVRPLQTRDIPHARELAAA